MLMSDRKNIYINQYFRCFNKKSWCKTFLLNIIALLVTCKRPTKHVIYKEQHFYWYCKKDKSHTLTTNIKIHQRWLGSTQSSTTRPHYLTDLKPVSMYQAIKPRIIQHLTDNFKMTYPRWELPLVKIIFRSMFAVVLPSVRDCRGRGEWRLGWLRLAMTSSRCARAPAAPLRSRTGTVSRPPWRKTLENVNARTLPTAHLHRQTAFWTKRKK